MTPEAMAEAGFLGALLLDPAARGQMPVMRADDFADPWHRELFLAIAEDSAAQRAGDAVSIGLALRDRLGPARADLHRVQGVLAATPPGAAPATYARMVLESSVRRSVAQQAVILRAGGLQSQLSLSGSPVRDAAAVVRGSAAALQTRWDAASGDAVAAAKARHPSGRPGDLSRMLLGADRFIAAHPERDRDLERQHERELVAALIHRPDAAPPVAEWLKPDHMLDPEWAAAYAAVLELAAAGDPVDEITVSWSLRHGERHRGPGPEPRALHDAIEAGVASDPAWPATRVAGDLARRTSELAAASLVGAAGNPGLTVADLLHTAEVLAGAVAASGAGLGRTAPPSRPNRHLTLVAAQDLAPAASVAMG